MTKRKKALIIVLACLLGAGLLLATGDSIVSWIAQQRLKSALAEVPDARIDFKKMYIALIPGYLEIQDVQMDTRDTTKAGSPGIEARVDKIRLEGVQWLRALLKAEAHTERLVLHQPKLRVVLAAEDTKKKAEAAEAKAAAAETAEAKAAKVETAEAKAAKVEAAEDAKDSTAAEAMMDSTASVQNALLKRLSLSEARIEEGEVEVCSLTDSLQVSACNINFSVKDLGWQMADSLFSYNDSCYHLSLDSLDYIDAQGLSRVQAAHIGTTDAGPIEATALHLYSCVPKKELAERLGKVAAMWYDVDLESLHTCPLNLPRLIESRSVKIDSINLHGKDIVILQDDRYPPAVPYPTLQEGMNAVQLPLEIKRINARIDNFKFIWATTHINCGELPLRKVRLTLGNVSNAPDNTMELFLNAGMGRGSSLNFSLWTRNDKQEHIKGKFQVDSLDTDLFDPFLRPPFGVTAECRIHHIDGLFNGDKHKASGELCMLYDDLKIHAWKGESPYKLIAKNSGVINFFAPMLLPKSNPSKKGKEPKMAPINIERDPMVPYPAYLIQALTNGMMNTVLPDIFVKKNK